MSKKFYTLEQIKQIRQQPHLLGLLAGQSKLTPLHSEWIRYIFESDKDVGLMGHRGSYKTTCNAVGIVWWLAFHPDDRIFMVRKTFTGASEIVRLVGQIMQMDTIKPLLEQLWGGPWKFTILRDGKMEHSAKQSKTKEASLTALGLDSNWTGLHGRIAVIDDAVTLEDRVSEAERERTKMIIQEIRANIIDPGGHSAFIGTPWARHDAWDMLEHPEGGGRGIEVRRYPVSSTGLLTPEEIADKKSKTTPTLYAINYDLKFESEEGMMFTNPYMGIWHEDNVDIKAHLDAKYKGDHYCALTIMGRQPNGRLNLVGFTTQENVKDWFGFIRDKLIKYKVRELYSEDNADKGYTLDILEMCPELRKAGVWMEEYHETEKKHVKITNYLGEVFKEIEFSKESHPEYIEQLTDWREGVEPDDCADSASSLVKYGGYSKTAILNSWGVWDF